MGEADGVETKVAIPMPVGGTAGGLQVRTNVSAGGGNNWVFVLYVNGSATSIGCTIADAATNCSDGANSVALTAGDRVTLRQQGNSNPSAASVTWSFYIDQ
ncbi:hypothetical protein [Dokdonella immobilis]|nr:hypothetical protein [Dokdonella immobilis]